MIRRCLVEFIGTFFLALIVCASSFSGDPNFTSLAAGFVLAALIYSSAHLSGAHFNPMVTIAIFLRGKINLNMVPLYIMSQLAGASLAALIAILLNSNKQLTIIDLSNTPLEGILTEFIGTFVIAYVVLNVATSKNTQGNDYYGLAIGLTFTACIIGLGGITGGAFNPALALAIAIGKISSFSNLWIYWIGEIAGGVLAAITYLFIIDKD